MTVAATAWAGQVSRQLYNNSKGSGESSHVILWVGTRVPWANLFARVPPGPARANKFAHATRKVRRDGALVSSQFGHARQVIVVVVSREEAQIDEAHGLA